MTKTLIHKAQIVNDKEIFIGSVLIEGAFIKKIFRNEVPAETLKAANILDAAGKVLIPGVIDDQVHFRDFELAYKADFYTESKAAVAGGVTSFLDMPNTKPQTTTINLLEGKFAKASETSLANYSFYFGATNDNIDEIKKIDASRVCGLKVFMGSSTGNMLVDNEKTLERIFTESPVLIATHCEYEPIIKQNTEKFHKEYGDDIPVKYHPEIRNEESCYRSSAKAVELAKKFNSRLHILHLTTAKEMALFSNDIPAKDKKITAEVCVHHLWFEASDYEKFGMRIKWNPAIKSINDRDTLRKAVIDNRIDVVATDHAPHTINEKQNPYMKAPSGGPLVQHSLVVMLEMYHKGVFSLEKIVEKMCHSPADIFQIEKRGYIREGYYADLVLLDLNSKWIVNKSNILYKCAWSPFEETGFKSKVEKTFVNGMLLYDNGNFREEKKGMPLQFNR